MKLSAAEEAAQDAASLRDAGLGPGRRLREGIVHTPPALARCVARIADGLLRAELGVEQGLASDRVALVDPACGPGAFLAAALAVGAGQGSSPRAVLGVDRDAAAVEVAEHAVGSALLAAGWPCALRVCDTLSALQPVEAAALGPVVCVLGNPPWVGSAQERPAPWLDVLLDDFRRDADGVSLAERKIGVLSDAYVRFVRWACEVARLAQDGALVALVTNGSYLDGPVHRGMRAALLRYFDALHIVDLGGNALLAHTKERDGNVFGVRTSAAVLFGVRRRNCDERVPASVRYLRPVGSAQHKLEYLESLASDDPAWRTLTLDARYQRFVPTSAVHADYASWPSLPELMPFHREGVQTNRDDAVIDTDRERLLHRLRDFAQGREMVEFPGLTRPLGHYDPSRAREALQELMLQDPDGSRGLWLRRLAYRPLDTRWFAPFAPLCHRPRPELLAAMDHSAFALVTARKDRGNTPWAHFSVANAVIDNCLLSTRSSCRARAFPTHDPQGRENLDQAASAPFAERIGRSIGVVELAHYALAVFADPTYRLRHDAALHVDYPRIPPPRDLFEFEHLRDRGCELSSLFCDALEVSDLSDEVDATYAQVKLDPATGELRLGSEALATLSRGALELLIGQHRPLQSFLRARANTRLDLPLVRALCARVDALAVATMPTTSHLDAE